MKSRKNEPSLFRIVLFLLILLTIVAGGYRAIDRLRHGVFRPGIENRAPDELNKAKQLIEENNVEEARKILESIVARVRHEGVLLNALMTLARLENRVGNLDKGIVLLRRAVQEFPANPDRPRVTIELGRTLENAKRYDEAAQAFQEVANTAAPEVRAPALVGLGRHAERAGQQVEAREWFRRASQDAPWGSPEWEEAAEVLGRVNVALVFSPELLPESKIYVVEKGDSLISIGMKLNTTLGMLTRANNLSESDSLRVGQRLKYTPKDFRIVIERSTCRLYLMDKDGLFKKYPVGLGMPGHETALGSYKIGNKQKDPTWFKPGEGEIPPGDPRNELGTRWMPLIPVEEGLPTDLGIHGTIRPETVGGFHSQGCARLLQEDVEELYDLVVRSTPVDIVEVFRP